MKRSSRRKGRRRSRLSDFAAGLIAIVVIVVATFFGFTKSIPFKKGWELKARFQNTSQIKKNSPVRIAGVNVGKVTRVEPSRVGGESAIVTMEIQDKGLPIHKDASAKIRPRIFLEGNFFVELTPGSPSAPVLESGDVIPLGQTAVPVQFDQVLSTFDSGTREDLRGALAELFRAYQDGAAGGFNRSLEFQPDAFRYTAVVADALHGENAGDLGDWIRDMSTVSTALNSPPLPALIRDFNTTAGALAAEQDALRSAIGELPQTLRAAAPAFDALNASFPSVRRLAVDARPGVRSTGPALDALRPLTRQLRGLVGEDELRGLAADLRASTPQLASLVDNSIPLLRQGRLVGSCVNEVLVPYGNSRVGDPNFPARATTNEEFWHVLPGLAGESRSFDGNGQWFKVLGGGGLETLTLGNGLFGTSASPVLGTNPPKAAKRPPIRADVPCETQEVPNLNSTPGGAPRSVSTDRSSGKLTERRAKARAVAALELGRRLQETGVLRKTLDLSELIGPDGKKTDEAEEVASTAVPKGALPAASKPSSGSAPSATSSPEPASTRVPDLAKDTGGLVERTLDGLLKPLGLGAKK